MDRKDFVRVILLTLVFIINIFIFETTICESADLSQCIQSMLKHNSEIQGQTYKMEYQRLSISAARKEFLPSLDLIGSAQRFRGDRRYSVISGGAVSQTVVRDREGEPYSFGLRAVEPLVKNGSLLGIGSQSVEIAKCRYMIEENRKTELENDLVLALCQRFVSLEGVRYMRKLCADVKECVAKKLELAREKSVRGLVAKEELSKAEAEDAAWKAELERLNSLEASLEQDIRMISGISPQEPIELTGLLEFSSHDIKIPEDKILIEMAINRNPHLAMLKAEQNALKSNYLLLRKSRLPEVTASAQYLRVRDMQEEDRDNYWSIELAVRMNILDFGRTKTRIKQAHFLLLNKEKEVEQWSKELITRVKSLRKDLLVLLYQLREKDALVKTRKVELAKLLLKNQSGTSSATELCEARKKWIRAVDQQLAVKEEIRKKIFELRTVVGLPVTRCDW